MPDHDMENFNYYSEANVPMRSDMPIGIEKKRQMNCVSMHSHEFIELAFVASGSAVHTHSGLDGRHRVDGLIQGDLFTVHIGESHSMDQCGSMVLYNIFFRANDFDSLKHLQALPNWGLLFEPRNNVSDKIIHLPATQRIRAVNCLEQALVEYRMTPNGYKAMFSALIQEFLVLALRSENRQATPHALVDSRILESISAMESQPEQYFYLDQLAQNSCMSVASYTRKFRQSTGMSPMEYLLNLRLNLARHYLFNSEMPIGEIAERCGMSSPNYLIKQFRSKFGCTPSQFRKPTRQSLEEVPETSHR